MIEASGIGTYVRNLLPLLLDRCPEVPFRLLGDSRAISLRALAHRSNVEVVDCRAPIYSLVEQFQLLPKIPKRGDLFWCPHYDVPLLHKGGLVVTVHDVFHLAMPEFVRGVHRRVYARTVFAAMVRKASRILCVSQFTADELVRLTGCDAMKMRVIHNGIAHEWFEPSGRFGAPDEPYLLFVGNVKPHKNLSALLDALQIIKEAIPHRLIIVGKKEGFLTGDTQVAGRAVSLGSRVEFTGQVTDIQLKSYYEQADALVFPSLYEGFGLPPLEAMGSDCPCVVSDIPALREVCGNAALYCDPNNPADIADKIVEIIENKNLREQLKGLGRARARLFTWERSAEATHAAIKEALNE